MEKPFLTLEEVAEYLNVDYQLVYKLVRTGQLPAVKIGRIFRIRPTELEAYLVENTLSPLKSLKKKCSICEKEYNSNLMLKYVCAFKGCSEPVCVDCRERKKKKFCQEHSDKK